MSDATAVAAPLPAGVGAGPTGLPVKMPMKMPMKVPMKIPMKMPMPTYGAPFKAPIPAPAKMHSGAPASVVARPAPKAVVKREVKKEATSSSSSSSDSSDSSDSDTSGSESGSDDTSSASSGSSPATSGDSDDDALLLAKKKKPVRKAAGAKKARAPPVRRERVRQPKRGRAVESGTSSSDTDEGPEMSGDEEDNKPMFLMAQERGVIRDEDIHAVKKEEPMQLPVGPPPRPYRLKQFPSDIAGKIEALTNSLQRTQAQMKMKDEGKTVSLGTSKVNYIDPRIVYAFSKKNNVPIEKLFTASLVKKFPWAADIDADYAF
jgi:DNA topoisomerase-1